MSYNGYGCDDIMFNRYTNLDSVEWRIIDSLIYSESKHANNLWKLLKYSTEDCLLKPNLTTKEKINLVYQTGALSTNHKVFMLPFVDDAWLEQAARLDIFVQDVYPKTHITSVVTIGIEVVVHNKINNIYGDASAEEPTSNPSELTTNGEIKIPVKSRATTMLKCVLAELNGKQVAGVGELQLNTQLQTTSIVKQETWNQRAYFGYKITMATLMSGVSSSPMIGP